MHHLAKGGRGEEICHASSLHWRKQKKRSKREILAVLMRHMEEMLDFDINFIIQVTLKHPSHCFVYLDVLK